MRVKRILQQGVKVKVTTVECNIILIAYQPSCLYLGVVSSAQTWPGTFVLSSSIKFANLCSFIAFIYDYKHSRLLLRQHAPHYTAIPFYYTTVKILGKFCHKLSTHKLSISKICSINRGDAFIAAWLVVYPFEEWHCTPVQRYWWHPVWHPNGVRA